MKRNASYIAAGVLVLASLFGPALPASSAPPEKAHVHMNVAASMSAANFELKTVTQQSGPYVVVVKPGDTYGLWAKAHCGNFSAWKQIQLANGWPERRIPVGANAIINCDSAINPKAPVKPQEPVKAATTTSSGWVHPLASGAVSNSCYRTAKRPSHGGVDLRANIGTPIRSASAGTISLRAYEGGGAGHYVLVKHANGMFTRYHHMREKSPLGEGTKVDAGQTIGHVGMTGNSTGPHLHFEVMRGSGSNGGRINPAPFMRNNGVNVGC